MIHWYDVFYFSIISAALLLSILGAVFYRRSSRNQPLE